VTTTRPFSGKYLATPARLSKDQAIPNLKSLAQAVLKICLIVCQKFRGHVTSHTPFGESYLSIQSAFHMRISYWSNLKSVAQIIFKIFGIVCHKFLPVTWPRPRPFWGKLLARPLVFSKWKLCTKFKVSSSSSFEDMFDCMPKIEGSRDLGHAPFGENYLSARSAFPRGSCVPNLKSLAWVVLKIRSIVFRKF